MSSQPTLMLRRKRRWCQSWRCSVTLETTWTLWTCWGPAPSEVREILGLIWFCFLLGVDAKSLLLSHDKIFIVWFMVLFLIDMLTSFFPSQYWPHILESQYHWLQYENVQHIYWQVYDAVDQGLSRPKHWSLCSIKTGFTHKYAQVHKRK